MRDAAGKFTKGNPGKPKNAKNKVANAIREKFNQLLEGITIESLRQDLQDLEPAERLKIIAGLAEYVLPKLARTAHQIEAPEVDTEIILQVKGSRSPLLDKILEEESEK